MRKVFCTGSLFIGSCTGFWWSLTHNIQIGTASIPWFAVVLSGVPFVFLAVFLWFICSVLCDNLQNWVNNQLR